MPTIQTGALPRMMGTILTVCLYLGISGCGHLGWYVQPGAGVVAPNEQNKLALPPYVIDSPDVLQVNIVNLIPKATQPIQPQDVISVKFPSADLPPDDFKVLAMAGLIIDANFSVELDGTILIGPPYNLTIPVNGLTQKEAEQKITEELKKVAMPKLVEKGKVRVGLIQTGGLQLVQGPHLVRPDGTIGLGIYGSVFVKGLTLDQAKLTIEQHLAEYLLDPKISLDVAGYNSKVYYIIFDGGGLGEQVLRLPVTGNETVLDAVGQVNGLPAVASRSHVWIARPGHTGTEGDILPVDWRGITQKGVTETNYQVLPGDRLYVKADPLITLYTYVDRFIAPAERVMGAILLGSSTYRSLKFINSSQFGFGGF